MANYRTLIPNVQEIIASVKRWNEYTNQLTTDYGEPYCVYPCFSQRVGELEIKIESKWKRTHPLWDRVFEGLFEFLGFGTTHSLRVYRGNELVYSDSGQNAREIFESITKKPLCV
jgi:hypothetical protein